MKYVKVEKTWIKMSDEEAEKYEREISQDRQCNLYEDVYDEPTRSTSKTLLISIILTFGVILALLLLHLLIECWLMDALQRAMIYISMLWSETDFAHTYRDPWLIN